MVERLIVVGTLSFALAAACTPLLRSLLLRFRVLDIPNVRSSHSKPTPRGAGITIIVAVLGSLPLARIPFDQPTAWMLWGALVISLLGFIDDVRSLPQLPKLGVQVASGLLLSLGAHVVLGRLAARALSIPHLLAMPLTVLWVVGVCNAFNFMDGINGIAAVEAVICGSTIGILAARRGDLTGASLAFSLAAANAGFLPWNFPVASVFMGDAGSVTTGWLLAALAVRYSQSGGSFLAAALPLMPFLFDTSVTMMLRAVKGEKIWSAHRSHLYQRLVRVGWTHEAVTALWGTLAAACAVVALLIESWPLSIALISGVCLIVAHVGVALGITVADKERRGLEDSYRRADPV